MDGENGRIAAAGGRFEAIPEPRLQQFTRHAVGIDRDLAAHGDDQWPEIVDAMHVVRVRVRKKDRVQPLHMSVKELLAQIRRRIHQDDRGAVVIVGLDEVEQRRRRFFGLVGSHAPQPAPTRGTPPEEPQPRIVTRQVISRIPDRAHRPPSSNEWVKFSVVISAISLWLTPTTSARTRAVCAT